MEQTAIKTHAFPLVPVFQIQSIHIQHSLVMAQAHFLLLSILVLNVYQQAALEMKSIDLEALAAIKNSLTDINPGSGNFFSTWDFTSPRPCSTFSGVSCYLGRVTSLTLGTGLSDSPGLAGQLSPALSNLTQLTQLVLHPGIVTGPIPPQLARLDNLRVISLTNNRLTGSIPTSLSMLRKLHTLDLSQNQLTGSIPLGILTGLRELRVLILASNSLTGEFPSCSSGLLHLDLRNNRLRGTLPLEMPSSLRYLSISRNEMWGPINGLESLPDLEHLDLSMNQFNGPIPHALLFRVRERGGSLSSLLLQRNNLSGGVPLPLPSSSPLLISEGSTVDLSHNSLSGELTGVLAGVESLFLNNNRWTGKVPKEYVDSLYQGTTQTLYLQHNYITAFPLDPSLPLPDTVSLCFSYNCIAPPLPLGMATCPASAGSRISRPESQCMAFNNGSTVHH
ncbi:DNA damage-repair/toleration protein DRT100 [Mercurialis annua]|uniref:DNA damage-repair/toleration protein DRT100 n=1 Tax=Mercurialis annua TaxID=3986 RepID=UPI00215FD3FC|nr:DNA damage-repair/toleration protein DRT100 [Mercurialis annua]